MDNQARPAFEQGHGPPSSQPYANAMPERSPTSHEGLSIQYPQYSYDIHMRYEDPNRPYPSDPSRAYPLEATRPYQHDPHGQQGRDVPRQYEQVPNPYAKEIPNHHFPPSSPYSPMPHQGQGVQLPSLAMSGIQGPGYGPPQEMIMDTTGQVAPAGMKPRVTATLWEDEGTLCFQVDVKGTCVARREDNHMVNGTKLLNVAGMTRGRRDGILKAEKQKHVVKIGPMHLKGVWIPYERALAFANKEHITPLLYPIFVHNIGALLYHPINHARTGSFPTPALLAGGMPVRQNGFSSPYNASNPHSQVQSPLSPTPEAVLFNSARVHEPQPQQQHPSPEQQNQLHQSETQR